MRKLTALALTLAVQGAAVSGLFVHAHPDEHATAHHGGRALHVHWSPHAHSAPAHETPTVRTHDHDRAVFLSVFVAVAAPLLSVAAPSHGVFTLSVPAESRAFRRIDVIRSHDPPVVGTLPSRAPPTLSVLI